MKRITVILALTTLAAWAASPLAAPSVPQVINLQGRFTDSVGNNVADGAYTVLFRIYDDTTAGSVLWSEILPVQVTGGLFTVLVGNSTAIPADLFSDGPKRYLGVTVNLEPEMPRIPLSSVAYAYQAQDADVATLAQDLTCVSCVSAGDLATNSVGADEIAAGAVGTSEVLDGSLTAIDIDDEPGVASNTSTANTPLGGTVQTLLSRVIVGPAAGYVLAIATAEVAMSHTNGTISFAWFGVSSTADVFPANQGVAVQLPSTAPSGHYIQAVTVHGLFSTVGGADNFFFLGNEGGGDFGMDNLQLTLIYFPTAYGTVVSTAAASGGEELSSQSIETGLVLPEFVGEPVQSQVASPAGFQPDLAQVIVQMEARIQKLEEQLSLSQPEAEEKK